MFESYLYVLLLTLQISICGYAEAAILDNGTITIAIIDTGIDANHPELKDALWTNPKEIHNGRDDDGNGLIDDIHGWDFVKKVGQLSDQNGHGTHIAGIIHQAVPQARLMMLRFYDPNMTAADSIHLTAKAIRYATRMKVQIINYSGGGPTAHQDERDALFEAEQRGILVIAAAGNDSSNTDRHPYFPADYPLPNIMSVAAHNPKGVLLTSSNYGVESVDLSAPGENIVSTLPGGKTGVMTGTSQATANVTSAAALAWLKFPHLRKPQRMIEHLKITGQYEYLQQGKTQSGHRLNSIGALKTIEQGLSADFRFFYDGNSELLDGTSQPPVISREPSSPISNLDLARRLTQRANSTDLQSPYRSHRLLRD